MKTSDRTKQRVAKRMTQSQHMDDSRTQEVIQTSSGDNLRKYAEERAELDIQIERAGRLMMYANYIIVALITSCILVAIAVFRWGQS